MSSRILLNEEAFFIHLHILTGYQVPATSETSSAKLSFND